MLALFAAAALVLTLLGGLLPLSEGLISRAGMRRLFALRSGILLSVAFTEVLPEAWQLGRAAAGWGAVGAFTFLYAMSHFAMLDACPEYLEECRRHTLGAAALLALLAHSFIDGFNLSVAFGAGQLAGAAVGTALALHKAADGFALASLLRQNEYSRPVNVGALVLVAAATPVGCASNALGFASLSAGTQAAWMGFAAGSFIYIGASDILPRLHQNEDKASLAFFGMGLLGLSALRLV